MNKEKNEDIIDYGNCASCDKKLDYLVVIKN